MVLTRITPAGLHRALALSERELVSIVGGGGKTTTLFALGAQSLGSTILTTTTKMGSERDEGIRVLIAPDDRDIGSALETDRQVLVWSDRTGHRAEGVAPQDCDRWFESAVADHVIVEADGSRRRPFKAPYPYEPVVPKQTTLLIACIGASALGQPIGEGCHRSDAVVALVGGSIEDPLTPAATATVLLHDDGSQKHRPTAARFAVLIHQVREPDLGAVQELVDALGDTETHIVDAISD